MGLRQPPDRLAISLDLPHPVETVWEKLTQPQYVARWWGDHVELDAAPGGRFIERWRDPATGRTVETTGAVTLREPPERLELTWADDDWPVVTEVALRLEPAPAGTRLTLEHRGWDRFPPPLGRELLEQHAAPAGRATCARSAPIWRRAVRTQGDRCSRGRPASAPALRAPPGGAGRGALRAVSGVH